MAEFNFELAGDAGCVLTYNIHGWRNAPGAVDVGRAWRIIQASGADVVALNEVFTRWTHPMAAKRRWTNCRCCWPCCMRSASH